MAFIDQTMTFATYTNQLYGNSCARWGAERVSWDGMNGECYVIACFHGGLHTGARKNFPRRRAKKGW